MDAQTGTELVKLLLQVVTADHVVSLAERQALDAAAKRLGGLPAEDLVRRSLDDGLPLPAPNMGLLKQHRTVVLLEVARVGGVDGFASDELDLVHLIAEMLG